MLQNIKARVRSGKDSRHISFARGIKVGIKVGIKR